MSGAVARQRAGLSDSAELRVFPHVRPLEKLFPETSSDSRNAARASLLADAWGPAWQLATRAGLSAYGPLMLPGSWTFE